VRDWPSQSPLHRIEREGTRDNGRAHRGQGGAEFERRTVRPGRNSQHARTEHRLGACHGLRLSCLMGNRASPLVRCDYPSHTSAVYSRSCISTARSYTQYNLSSILQFLPAHALFLTRTELEYSQTVVVHVYRNGSELANLDIANVSPTFRLRPHRHRPFAANSCEARLQPSSGLRLPSSSVCGCPTAQSWRRHTIPWPTRETTVMTRSGRGRHGHITRGPRRRRNMLLVWKMKLTTWEPRRVDRRSFHALQSRLRGPQP
jgi:hypothetical protein